MSLFDLLVGKKSRLQTKSRTRPLRFDELEGRVLLTTVPFEPVPTTIADFVVNPTESGAADFSLPGEPGNGAGAPAASEFDEGGGGSGGGEGGGGGGSEQPVSPLLFDFHHSVAGNTYTFTGYVVDNNLAGITIYFGGIISGMSCATQPDGSFSFAIEMNEPSGVVTAIAQDAEQLWSNQMCDYL